MGEINKKLFNQVLEYSSEFLSEIEDMSISKPVNAQELKNKLHYTLSDEGVGAEQVIHDLVQDTRDGLLGSGSGRFFGWVMGGAYEVGIAAEWLTSVWDQNAAIAACSPAAAVVEEIAGEWLKDVLKLPKAASFGFVTGCQSAHIIALAAARHNVLKDYQWDVEKKGLFGAPSIKLITSENRHETLTRAARIVGLGSDCIELIGCDEQGAILIDALEQSLQNAEDSPCILCLQAGDLNMGSFDSFSEAIPLAKKYNCWVHVDGAFGLWANASKQYSHLLKGVEQADSWATDGHKWLNINFGSGFIFVSDPEAHSAALSQHVSYGGASSDIRDQMNWNLEWSRRARAFSVYATLRHLGKKGIEDLVNRCCHHTQVLVETLGKMDGVEVLADPVINQGLVRFLDPHNLNHDDFTDKVISAIQKEGHTWFGGVHWRGKRAMRISVCNWRTNEQDIQTACTSVQNCLNNVQC